MIARVLLLALVFQAAAKDLMDDATFEVVTRELEADLIAETSDVDDALRRLSGNQTTTTMMTTATPTPLRVVGTLEIGGMTRERALLFAADAGVQLGLRRAIASKAGSSVTESDVTVDISVPAARRLQELDAEPRALQGTVAVTVTYTITGLADMTAADAVAATLSAVSDTDFQTEIVAQINNAEYTITVKNVGVQTVAAGGTTAAFTTAAPATEAPTVDGATKVAVTSSMFVLASAWLASAQL